MGDFCKIYAQSELELNEFSDLISNSFALKSVNRSLCDYLLILDIIENDEYCITKMNEFPDGFLYFKYYLEVERTAEGSSIGYRMTIGKFLLFLWEKGMPAVAACDFESELPFNGGYKSLNVPFPK